MTNFERVTKSPEALGEFLGGLDLISSPWESDFCRAFCDDCDAKNCDAENCAHTAERDNPLWWLMQEARE